MQAQIGLGHGLGGPRAHAGGAGQRGRGVVAGRGGDLRGQVQHGAVTGQRALRRGARPQVDRSALGNGGPQFAVGLQPQRHGGLGAQGDLCLVPAFRPAQRSQREGVGIGHAQPAGGAAVAVLRLHGVQGLPVGQHQFVHRHGHFDRHGQRERFGRRARRRRRCALRPDPHARCPQRFDVHLATQQTGPEPCAQRHGEVLCLHRLPFPRPRHRSQLAAVEHAALRAVDLNKTQLWRVLSLPCQAPPDRLRERALAAGPQAHGQRTRQHHPQQHGGQPHRRAPQPTERARPAGGCLRQGAGVRPVRHQKTKPTLRCSRHLRGSRP